LSGVASRWVCSGGPGRSLLALTQREREEISRGIVSGSSIREIAKCLVSIHVKLRKIVASKLILDWSPEQVSGWLKTQYPDDESLRVSHETIYRSLFIQARGGIGRAIS